MDDPLTGRWMFAQDARARAAAALETAVDTTTATMDAVRRTRTGDAKVLVVDDDPYSREACAALLESEGYEVTLAADGFDALERLRHGVNPRLILLDFRMPRMDGLHFRAEQVKDRALATIPVVVCSASDAPGAIDCALRVDDWLRKPVDPDLLVRTVRKYAPVPACPG